MAAALREPPAADATPESRIWELLSRIPDPEIPVLSILDLGIVRYVRTAHDQAPRVGLTPTYSACPATEVIQKTVGQVLARAGYPNAVVETVLSPPWTSDWITEEGRRKLAGFGIAPPAESVSSPKRLFGTVPVSCPRCASRDTQRVSEFGSTPCKAHYRCNSCLEPFDYFKCI
jgi:ring-1,2-phenylacetyl-CoA epoxidase subunit PaaD